MEKTHGQDMRAGEGECLRSVHALWGISPFQDPHVSTSLEAYPVSLFKSSKELSILSLLPSLEVSWWVENSLVFLVTTLYHLTYTNSDEIVAHYG